MSPIRLDEIQDPIRLDTLSDRPQRLDELDDRAGFVETFFRDPEYKIPFGGFAAKAIDEFKVIGAVKRLQEKEYEPEFLQRIDPFRAFDYEKLPEFLRPKTIEELKQQDIELVEDYTEWLAEQDRGYTTMGQVGRILSEMPAFMIEFLATGGMAAFGKGLAKKGAAKLLGKYATTKAGKAAIATGGFVVGTAARAAGMPHRAAEAVLSRQLPQDVQIKDDGTIRVIGPIEQPMTSLWKGLADHYIEIASEQAGEYLAPTLNRLFTKLPLMGKFTGLLQKRWLRLHPAKNAAAFARKMGDRVGFHGVLAEIGEEYLGDISRAIVDVEHFGAGEDANMLERISAGVKQDTRNLPAMAIAFSVPGITGQAVSALSGRQIEKNKVLENEIKIARGIQLNTPTQIETAEGLLGFEDEFEIEKYEELKPRYIFRAPPLGKIFTPKWTLNRLMGVETLLEDVDKAELARQLEERDLNSWINKITKQIKKQKSLKAIPEILPEVAEREAAYKAGTLFALTEEEVKKTAAHKLYRKIKVVKPIEIMRDLLDTYDEAPEFLDEDSKNTFNQVRELTRYLRVRANMVRKEVGLPLIRYTEGYITHWMDSIAKQIVKKDLPIHYGYLYYLMQGLPKKVKNPTQMQRTVRGKMENYFSKDLGKLLRVMTRYDLRDIYITKPYMVAWDELNRLRREQIIPDSVFRETQKYMEYDIRKFRDPVDKAFDATLKKPTDLLNKMLKPFKVTMDDPGRSLFSGLRRLAHVSGLGFRTRPLTRNLGQRLLLLDLYRISDYAKAQAVAFGLAEMPQIRQPMPRVIALAEPGISVEDKQKAITHYRNLADAERAVGNTEAAERLDRQAEELYEEITKPIKVTTTTKAIPLIDLIREQDWYKAALRKFEDIDVAIRGIETVALIPYGRTHIGSLFLSNVEVSALTGYFDWQYRYQQSKDINSKHFKNCSKRAKQLKIPIQELLTNESDMMWNIREAVRRTQWEYFSISMPIFYRGQFKRAMGVFQSWWMNYFFNHCRELTNQMLTGRNSQGRLLTPAGRLRALKGMGTLVAIGKAAKTLFGIEMLKYLFIPLPSYLPPIPELVAGIIQYFAADDERERKQAWGRVKYGLKFWIPFSGMWRDLNRFLSGEYDIWDLLFYRRKAE